MSNLQSFPYKGSNISFNFTDTSKMINATEMAKPFGKRVNDFLNLPQTNNFIKILITRFSCNKDFIVKTVRGRYNSGTWMHEKLALKFASWLAPEFELWIYDKIQELLTTGQTSLKSLSPAEILVMQANMLLEQEKAITENRGMITEQEQRLSLVEAKISTKNEDYFTISGFCSLYGWAVNKTDAIKYGKKASRISRDRNIKILKEHDSKYGNVNSYCITVLEDTFEATRLKKEQLHKQVQQLFKQVDQVNNEIQRRLEE